MPEKSEPLTLKTLKVLNLFDGNLVKNFTNCSEFLNVKVYLKMYEVSSELFLPNMDCLLLSVLFPVCILSRRSWQLVVHSSASHGRDGQRPTIKIEQQFHKSYYTLFISHFKPSIGIDFPKFTQKKCWNLVTRRFMLFTLLLIMVSCDCESSICCNYVSNSNSIFSSRSL